MTQFRFSDDEYNVAVKAAEEAGERNRKAEEEAKELERLKKRFIPPSPAEEARELAKIDRITYGYDDPGLAADKLKFDIPPNSPNNNNNNYSYDDGNGEPIDLADELIKKYKFVTVNSSKEIYYFNAVKGVYLPNGDVLIESELESRYVDGLKEIERNGSSLSKRSIDELIGHIQRRTYIDISALNAEKEWLACKDCMLNLVSGETAPFDPKYLNTTQIPVKYHLSARTPVTDFWYYCVQDPIVDSCPCPGIMKFLNEVMAPEDVELVLDFLAYCLWREYKFHKWILFNGAGQNGKSTFLNVIGRLIGPANVSGESLDRLLGNNFATANLYQKLVNVDADLSGDILKNTGKLKKLTGNDEYPAEFKFKPGFKFRNYAKLIFSCNEVPEFNDKTDAFFRRLIIINFTQQFFGEKEDPNLIDKLTTPDELSGLLYELLRRLPRVLSEGFGTTNQTMRDTYDKYVRGSNPVKYFADNTIQPDNDNVPIDQMYESYSWFCKAKKLPVESEQSFSRKMTKELGFQKKRTREGAERVWCWENIKLINWVVLQDKTQETLDGDDSDEGYFTDADREEMRSYNKTTGYYNKRKQKGPPRTTLSEKEIPFKYDNSDWDGKHRVDWNFNGGNDGHGNIINKASKELSEVNPRWSYTYQRSMKSRILRRRDKILSDAELLKMVSKRLERL